MITFFGQDMQMPPWYLACNGPVKDDYRNSDKARSCQRKALPDETAGKDCYQPCVYCGHVIKQPMPRYDYT